MKTPLDLSRSYSVAPEKYAYPTRLLDILNAANGSKNLTLAFYLVERRNFRYCNENFEALLGPKIDLLYERGCDFGIPI